MQVSDSNDNTRTFSLFSKIRYIVEIQVSDSKDTPNTMVLHTVFVINMFSYLVPAHSVDNTFNALERSRTKPPSPPQNFHHNSHDTISNTVHTHLSYPSSLSCALFFFLSNPYSS